MAHGSTGTRRLLVNLPKPLLLMLMTRRTASCNAIGGSSGCKNSRLAWARRADHAQYLDHWLSVTKTDNKSIFTAASKALCSRRLKGARAWPRRSVFSTGNKGRHQGAR